MLEKTTGVSQVEVSETGAVQVRVSTRIFEDGVQLTESFHRHVVNPGDDFSAEHPMVKAICAAVHTEAVIASHALSTQPG